MMRHRRFWGPASTGQLRPSLLLFCEVQLATESLLNLCAIYACAEHKFKALSPRCRAVCCLHFVSSFRNCFFPPMRESPSERTALSVADTQDDHLVSLLRVSRSTALPHAVDGQLHAGCGDEGADDGAVVTAMMTAPLCAPARPGVHPVSTEPRTACAESAACAACCHRCSRGIAEDG